VVAAESLNVSLQATAGTSAMQKRRAHLSVGAKRVRSVAEGDN
jgi:hypothetical protein